MGERDRVAVVSYRTVFDLERWVYRVGDYRLPRPVPLRGALWLLAALAGVAVCDQLPGLVVLC